MAIRDAETIRSIEWTHRDTELARIAKAMQDTTPVLVLARDGATDDEIADIVGIPVEVLHRQLASALRTGRAKLRMRIRRALLKAGDAGDSRVLGYLAVKHLETAPEGTDITPPAALLSRDGALRLASGEAA